MTGAADLTKEMLSNLRSVLASAHDLRLEFLGHLIAMAILELENHSSEDAIELEEPRSKPALRLVHSTS